MSLRYQMRYLNPYELHKIIVNEYVLKKPGDTKILERDKSKDRTDYHVLKDNHRFLWDDGKDPETWEEQFAKKYYEKLFREYCIADLSRYKENKVALRWRIEKEVVSGKGQFTCGNKHCNLTDELRSWEVNFAYQEQGQRKNALVKIRLCPLCSKKLNYHSQKREIKRLQKQDKNREFKQENKLNSPQRSIKNDNILTISIGTDDISEPNKSLEESPWESHKPIESKSLEEEMEEYLEDLLI